MLSVSCKGVLMENLERIATSPVAVGAPCNAVEGCATTPSRMGERSFADYCS